MQGRPKGRCTGPKCHPVVSPTVEGKPFARSSSLLRKLSQLLRQAAFANKKNAGSIYSELISAA